MSASSPRAPGERSCSEGSYRLRSEPATESTSTVAAISAGAFNYDSDDRISTHTYDADGNTVNSGGLNYVYDFENHLVQQGGASFVYDGDGNRVQKIVAGAVTHYFVDSVNLVAVEHCHVKMAGQLAP